LQECGFLKLFSILGILGVSPLLMPVTLTLLDYQYLCLWHVRSLSLDKRRKERRKCKGFLVGLEWNPEQNKNPAN
jgi:hypothetical protein